MSYFKDFPYTTYSIDGKNEVVTDILRRSTFIEQIKSNVSLYREYVITDGDTPENLAENFYGSVFLYWIILLFNEIHDPTFDWPMTDLELTEYCKEIYGENGMFSVRYYEKNGIIVGEYRDYDYADPNFIWIPPINPDSKDANIISVSHYEYESRLNEKKRNIKIVNEEIVEEILRQFKGSLK